MDSVPCVDGETAKLVVVVALVGVLLSVLVSLVLARRLVRPIRALTEGAGRIGAGDLGHRLEVKTGDEIEVRIDNPVFRHA